VKPRREAERAFITESEEASAMAKKKETLAEPSDGTIAVNDAWTGMLAVSLAALVIGSILLGYDMYLYSDKPPTVPTFASPSSLKKAADGAAPKADGANPMPKLDDAKDALPKDAEKKG